MAGDMVELASTGDPVRDIFDHRLDHLEGV